MTTVETIRARWDMAEMHVVEHVEVTALGGDPNDYTALYRHAWPDVAALLAAVDGLRAELAALQELYNDRDQDLEFEYTARLRAEVLNSALDDLAAYVGHLDGCPAAAISPSEPCCCGLDDAHIGVRRARAALADKPLTPYARAVAAGRACLAEAAARRDYMARIAADGCDDLAALQALRAAWAEARRARAAAVDAAMQGEA